MPLGKYKSLLGFPSTLLLSAALLFSIQPLVAKMLLPVYGGTPAVWTVCMLFFQALLLAAYSYVYLLSRTGPSALWRWLHSLLLLASCFSLPLLFHPQKGQGLPESEILYSLITGLGLPLFLVATTAPLLQFAYNQTEAKNASDPYFLYVASNVGSLVALLAYPWVVERFIGLQYQLYAWNVGYCLYTLLILGLLHGIPYQALPRQRQQTRPWPWKTMGHWIFLSFVPCSLMLSLTLYITTDVAATPLFWVLPLALYLLTFILAFRDKQPAFLSNNALFVMLVITLSFIISAPAWQLVLVHLSGFFMLAWLCHSILFKARPPTDQLTLFYFCLAFGGVLAGFFNGVIANHLFNEVYEYPLSLLLALLIIPLRQTGFAYQAPLLVVCLLVTAYYVPDTWAWKGFSSFQLASILALLCLGLGRQAKTSLALSFALLFAFIFVPSLQVTKPLVQERSFYAINKVVDKGGVHAFLSQSTLHGLQDIHGSEALNGYTAYYAALKPIMTFLQKDTPAMSATIVGLGTGTMLCQFRKPDAVKVIEIDKQVIAMASNPQLFTYLRDCPPSKEIVNQDGRLAVSQLPDHSQDVLILDAFNSDAIPIHLMTLEAFNLYKNKLKESGVLLVNISNRHLRLAPLINALAQNLDLLALSHFHRGRAEKGELNAEWAVLTNNQALAFGLMETEGWHLLEHEGQVLWTDDYSNLLPLMRHRIG